MSMPPLLRLPQELLAKIALLACEQNNDDRIGTWPSSTASTLCLVCRALLPFGREILYRNIRYHPSNYATTNMLERFWKQLARTVEESADTWKAASLVKGLVLQSYAEDGGAGAYALFGRFCNLETIQVSTFRHVPEPLLALVKSLPALKNSTALLIADFGEDRPSFMHLLRILAPTISRLHLCAQDASTHLQNTDFPLLTDLNLEGVSGISGVLSNIHFPALAQLTLSTLDDDTAELSVLLASIGPQLSRLNLRSNYSNTRVGINFSSCSQLRMLAVDGSLLRPERFLSLPDSIQDLDICYPYFSADFLARKLEPPGFLPSLRAIKVAWRTEDNPNFDQDKKRLEQACANRGMKSCVFSAINSQWAI